MLFQELACIILVEVGFGNPDLKSLKQHLFIKLYQLFINLCFQLLPARVREYTDHSEEVIPFEMGSVGVFDFLGSSKGPSEPHLVVIKLDIYTLSNM